MVAKRGDEEIGRDVLAFERMDGVAESFHTEQNRELLEKLATETGGRYWRPQDLSRLPGEISYSDAGITTRETKDLWNMPIVFLLILFVLRRMAAAAEVGHRMKLLAGRLARGMPADSCASRACGSYYVTVAGLGGEPDYDQRFTELGPRSRQLVQDFRHDVRTSTR